MSARSQIRRGFSLIELLCVLAIIGILLGLLLPAVSKAFLRVKRFEFDGNSTEMVTRISERLGKHFNQQKSYLAHTPEQLYRKNVIDSRMLSFLKDKRVSYMPFSSKDADSKIILLLRTGGAVRSVRKGDLKPKEE